jgi:hypothetical protein
MEIEEQIGLELDEWTSAGKTARIWWRDDDALSDTPQLRCLLDVARKFQIVVALGVIPQRADESLVHLVSRNDCCIWQHGWCHDFHVSGEFGDGRPLELMMHDALCGQRALDRLFGPSGWQPVFVPPNHSISMAFKPFIPRLGYMGLSAGIRLTPRLDHVPEVNAEVDIMNWPEGKILSASTVSEMIVGQLKSRRMSEAPFDRPIGILTHHLVLDDEAWHFVSRLFKFFRSHDTVRILEADRLFDAHRPTFPHISSSGARAKCRASPEVTVVLTSCGRPDLLARTLDSFLKYNTYPIHQFIVIEDGEAESILASEERYRQYNFKWVCTGKRVGQILAIDAAYDLVGTPYIFHCEDDWEFSAPGFVEKSLAVLEQNANVLQVWIRGLNDTNGHPIMNRHLFADAVPFRLMQPGYRSAEWGTWHGFSFNPGLRRRRDYNLIGSYGSLDPLRQKKSWEIEREVSEFYAKHGFFAAILADQQGSGYIRHIGWGRRVGEPHASFSTGA